MSGPLQGLRIIEFAGLGPAPYAAMLLADMGADIVRIDRPLASDAEKKSAAPHPVLRGRRSIHIDLTKESGAQIALGFIAKADALIEGYRPGKMEKLGLGPARCLDANPRLVYGRMTGWGQQGPLAERAGHDINYIAAAGVLGLIGRHGAPPTIPLNLVGDYGGGALFLALGIVSAILSARTSGKGQIVDAAMIDGAASLVTNFHFLRSVGRWRDERGVNLLDSGAPHYNVYETSDGKWMAVGALEPAFYQQMRERMGLTETLWDGQGDQNLWPKRIEVLTRVFKSKTRQEWCDVFNASDACVTPVLELAELADFPHHQARKGYLVRDGVSYPAPAPRFSLTPTEPSPPSAQAGEHTEALLGEIGVDADEVRRLLLEGVVA